MLEMDQMLLDMAALLKDRQEEVRRRARALLEGDVSRRRRREVIDQMAAVLILQSWLDTQE